MMVGEIVLDGWAVVRAICNSEEEAKARIPKIAFDDHENAGNYFATFENGQWIVLMKNKKFR